MAIASVGTLIANFATFLILISFAPRTDEGIRRVVTWPWLPYVAVAHILPLVLVGAVAFVLYRSWPIRLLIVAVAAITELLWFQFSGAHLLRRDFIGKF